MQRTLRADPWLWLASASLVPHPLRPGLLRRGGVEVGEKTQLRSGLTVVRRAPVVIGASVFVNHGCYLDARAAVTIGDDVLIGDHVRVLTSTHEPGPPGRRAGRPIGRPVVIGAGTWIGSAVTILPGVTVGAGCVIAAGAVVTQDCEPHGLYAGVPATRKQDLP